MKPVFARAKSIAQSFILASLSLVLIVPVLTAHAPVQAVTPVAKPAKSPAARKISRPSSAQATTKLPMARPEAVGMSSERLALLDKVIAEAIAHHETPGAVALVARHGKIVFRKAYGNRSLVPSIKPMEISTVFDMASLTKVVATATSMMILLERGAYRLDDPVSKYLPEFAALPKEKTASPLAPPASQPSNQAELTPSWDPRNKSKITIRQLLTHFSGLKPDFDLSVKWFGYDEAVRRLKDETLQSPPGTKFVYSDLNFIALGELVRKLSGETLDVFSQKNIFEPLDMRDTGFRPDAAHRERAAPTEKRAATEAYLGGKDGGASTETMIQGEVHDPTAWRMGGVAGHAGLFSTADDLVAFCQMILNYGEFHGKRILSPLGVETMTSNQVPAALSSDAPPNIRVARGLGWDMASSYSSNRGDLFDSRSFGHIGFTGTDVWIDASTDTFLILLTNRVHPDGKGNVTPLRAKIATLVAASILDLK